MVGHSPSLRDYDLSLFSIHERIFHFSAGDVSNKVQVV